MTTISATSKSNGQDWLRRASRNVRAQQLQVFAVRLIQLATQISAFWIFSELMHWVVVEQQIVYIIQIAPLVFALTLWAFCAWLSDYLVYTTKHKVESNLEHDIHKSLHSKQTSITRRFSSTFWQQLFLTNLNDIGEYLTQYNIQVWLACISPVIVLLVIFPVNYVVALTLLFTMPVIPLFMILVGKGSATLHRKHFASLERLGDLFSDRLKGLQLITATGQHKNQLERLESASHIVNRKTMKVVSVAFLSSTVLDFFSTISIALVAVFIGFTLLGELNIGPSINMQQGLFMLLVSPMLFSELRTLGRYYHQKAKAETGAERFSRVLDVGECSETQAPTNDVAWVNFHIQTPSLHASKLSIKNKDWILIRGASGSGKTALLEALMGFRRASHTLKGNIALLSQQASILDNTVAFNLHMGHDHFSNDCLEQALNSVGLSYWLSQLPNGLNTKLGDFPALSGGESQRLALARILLMQKDIVLLDEPTAHLTKKDHNQIIQLIRSKLISKTVIWVSHKPLPKEWFNQQWKVSSGQIEVQE